MKQIKRTDYQSDYDYKSAKKRMIKADQSLKQNKRNKRAYDCN